MSSGFVQGQIAGLIGGTIGGITGGINAKSHGGNFWTGKGAKYNMLSSSAGNSITIGEGMEYSNEYATDFSDKYFGKDVRGVDNLYADGSLPPKYRSKGDIVFAPNGDKVSGTAIYNGVGKGTDVYLYKAAFVCKEELYLVMGHEYMHAYFNSFGKFNDASDWQHKVINVWQTKQAVMWNYKTEIYLPLNEKINALPNLNEYSSRIPFSIMGYRPW
ncbi:MAG: hypothetical protein LBL18_01585 [Bacteroidales bacterium]|nr:hypothetical protein [Bacteroidales bacterium]